MTAVVLAVVLGAAAGWLGATVVERRRSERRAEALTRTIQDVARQYQEARAALAAARWEDRAGPEPDGVR